MKKTIFERFEKKYVITKKKREQLMELIGSYIEPDEFPHSKISNIYYDTDNNELIRRSMDKPKYKEKLRLRVYNEACLSGPAFIEIKKKYSGIVYKRRVAMTLQEALNYLDHGITPSINNQILSEIDYFMKFYQPKPALFLSYERDSFRQKDNDNVRITFDTNIQSRTVDLQLEKNLQGDALLEDDVCIMEIKVLPSYPLWLSNALTKLQIYPTSFSKYANVYRQMKG